MFIFHFIYHGGSFWNKAYQVIKKIKQTNKKI